MEYRDFEGYAPSAQNMQAPQPQSYPSAYPRKHSGLGIASLVFGVLACLIDVGVMVVGVVIGAAQGNPADIPERAAMVIGFVFLGGLCLNVVGLILGATGLFQRDRRPAFSIVGMIVNGLLLGGMCGLLGLGLAMS